jgi:hypothetical protein
MITVEGCWRKSIGRAADAIEKRLILHEQEARQLKEQLQTTEAECNAVRSAVRRDA